MLYSVNREHAATVDKLVFIAGGHLDLVIEAVEAVVDADGKSDLRDIVQYIVEFRA